MLRWSLIALVASACSHAASPAPTAPTKTAAAPPPSPCAQLADHVVSLMVPNAKDAPADKVGALRNVLSTRCDQDHWSDPAQQCFLAATTEDDLDKCSNQLTQAQTAALERDGKTAVDQLEAANNAAGAPPAPAGSAAAAPPPPAMAPTPAAQPAAKRATRGAKTSSDPCEGGQ